MLREPKANRVVEEQLGREASALEKHIDADVVSFLGPIYFGADDAAREKIEERKKKRPKLAVILETTGGYIEVAQRIADTFRHHYQSVEFIVPNYAMSAGTVLVMSGDAVHMDYYSVLGPIDPQVERDGKRAVPALGYLAKYKELIDKSKTPEFTGAELAYLLERFDPAELYEFEHARDLSKALLREWLAKYKFKDWQVTETQKNPVTQAMREERAERIASLLGSPERWHSHGRGISMEVLRRDLQLRIDDFGHATNAAGNRLIRKYYGSLVDYGSVLGLSTTSLALHSPQSYSVYWR